MSRVTGIQDRSSYEFIPEIFFFISRNNYPPFPVCILTETETLQKHKNGTSGR